MRDDFRKRTATALTHPIALVASVALLVAGIAALASLANGHALRADVISLVGLTVDGDVFAITFFHNDRYISEDGGMSWSESGYFSAGLEELLGTNSSVDTPRGEYSTAGSAVSGIGEISRIDENGDTEIVHLTEYLLGGAHIWMQERDNRLLGRDTGSVMVDYYYGGYSPPSPGDITYHAESGNVIAAMGNQGVVVGTPDGRWHRVAVGAHSPTDFSFSGKMRALLASGWLVGAIALFLPLSALAIAAAAGGYEYDAREDAAIAILAGLFCLSLTGAALGEITGALDVGIADIVVAVSLSVAWASAIIAAANKSNAGAERKLFLISSVSSLPVSIGLLFSFGMDESVYFGYRIDVGSRIGVNCCVVGYKALFVCAAFIAAIPQLWILHRLARVARASWRAFALALWGMVALIALSFALWLTLNVIIAAAQIAIIILVGLAAVVLVRHIRGERRPASLEMGESA